MPEGAKRRVAITGVGLVSCLGSDYRDVVGRLRAGTSGVRSMPAWRDLPGLRSHVAAPVRGLEAKLAREPLPKALAPGMSDAARYCAVAARDAVADAGLDQAGLEDPATGCFIGSGVGSAETVARTAAMFRAGHLRRADPFTVLRAMSSSPSAAVAALLGIRGRSYALSSACATSAHNIGHAYELIRGGLLERAVAGGGEEVNEWVAAAFTTLRIALSTRSNDAPERASRPYDQARDGFVLGGGGAVVVLEELTAARRRGACVRGELVGFGASSDAYDMVRPDPAGGQAAACMTMALDDAGLGPEAVDYVNTHGTSTPDGDIAELNALRKVFGTRMPAFSSTKSTTGHGLGAAGALELVFCLAMTEHGFIAPSINVEDPDPQVAGLPLVTEPRAAVIDVALSNSFGFGGSNAALVLRRAEADDRPEVSVRCDTRGKGGPSCLPGRPGQ